MFGTQADRSRGPTGCGAEGDSRGLLRYLGEHSKSVSISPQFSVC